MEKVKLTTTLALLRKSGMWKRNYKRLASNLSGKKFNQDCETYIRFPYKQEINLLTILELNGVDDCLRAFKTTVQDDTRSKRLIALAFARQVEHLNMDFRVVACNYALERIINGEGFERELIAAWEAIHDTPIYGQDFIPNSAKFSAWAAWRGDVKDAADCAASASGNIGDKEKEKILRDFLCE